MLQLPHKIGPAGQVLMLWLALSVSACVTTTATVPEPPVYPPPPEQARYMFEMVLATATDVEPASTSRSLREAVAGNASRPPNVFVKPLDVAARNGRIYVTDTLGKAVHVFDAARKRYFRLGFRREGALTKPTGVAVDDNGLVYVVDLGRSAIVVYDALGLYLRTIGGPEVLHTPVSVGVTADGSRIYVVENDNDRSNHHGVVAFDAAGRKVFARSERGSGSGKFSLPISVAVARDGFVYVLDAGNFRVQKLTADGLPVLTWGGIGQRPGQFARPRDLAVDDAGHVLVTDSSFGAVQIFDADGRLLMDLGRFGMNGQPGEFALLAGVAADETGRVYVVDQVLKQVTVFRPVSAK